jgi:hypothetical protein
MSTLMKRLAIVLALALCLDSGACGRASDAKLQRWQDVLAARDASARAPSDLASKQAYVDSLSAFLASYPDDLEARSLYEREQLEYARRLVSHGRYSTAIPYYESILERNPEHADARRELAAAKEREIVPRERFAALRRDMTMQEVRGILGDPRSGWIHRVSHDGRNEETWYYTKSTGGRASVSFRDGKAFLAEYDSVIVLPR